MEIILSGLVLLTLSAGAAYYFIQRFLLFRESFHFSAGMASFFLALSALFPLLEFGVQNVIIYDIAEWMIVISISFALSAMASVIRNSRPVFARFPKLLCFVPLFLILAYALLWETVVLKNWVLNLYQGGVIFIGLLIYGYKSSSREGFGVLVSGFIYFLTLYILNMLPTRYFVLPEYVWPLLVAAGIGIIVFGYRQLELVEDRKKVSGSSTEELVEWFN